MRTVLVTGFGPFLEVSDNPSARLVRALDGQTAGPWQVRGHVLDVSFERGPLAAIRAAHSMAASWVVGFGVSRRGGLRVERTGRSFVSASLDVDGCRPSRLIGPDEVTATLDVQALARVLGCPVSDDAGAYVCNAWLHQVVQHVGVPAAFVHIPPEGVDAEEVLRALSLFRLPTAQR